MRRKASTRQRHTHTLAQPPLSVIGRVSPPYREGPQGTRLHNRAQRVVATTFEKYGRPDTQITTTYAKNLPGHSKNHIWVLQ